MSKILEKWTKSAFSPHALDIIKGNIMRLFGENLELYEFRYNTYCKDCENREDSPVGEICGICGCPLKSKLRVEDEKCDMNKF